MNWLAICVLVSCLGFCSQVSGQNGIITTVAGNGTSGFSGDGGPATSASLNYPYGVAVDASGNLFIADFRNNRIRKVSASGIITTFAGNGQSGYSVYNGPATSASFHPAGVAVDASGNLFIADGSFLIRKVSASGIMTTVAGLGGGSGLGDGGPAISASLFIPNGVALDASGNLFIADEGNTRIRKVSASGVITTVAGNGTVGFSGDGGPATSASLNDPTGVAVDTSGNLFIAEHNNNRIRKVSVSGIVTTVAGNGADGFSGDGGPATSASLSHPYGVAVDTSGNLFISDSYNNRIRKVSASGVITTVAGGGTGGLGDGGPATSAALYTPLGVVVDASGNLFIADSQNSRIRKVSAPAPSGLPTQGGGQTVYSDLGTNGSFSSNGWCVSGPNGANCSIFNIRYIAASFAPGASSTLSGINLPLSNISGTNGAVVSLLNNASGGIPGTVLESWSVSNLPSYSQAAVTLTSVVSKLNPALQAGQTYWVEVQPLATDTMDYWYTNSLGLGGGLTNLNNAGWTPIGNNYGAQSLPAFSVLGIPLSSSSSYTGCNGQPATGNLQLWIMGVNTTTGVVQINGVVSGASNTPFTWNWGDGTTTQGFFPQSHTYSNVQLNYSLQVTSHENDGSTDCAQLGIIFIAQTAGSITSVTTAYAGPVIAQNDFIVIKGTNLVPANTPASGAIWSSAPSFASGLMPTQLGGVSVNVNNKPAFVYFYCSAATDPACLQDQLNILTPLDNTTGPVPVVVTSGGISSPPFTANMQAVVPSFLLFSTAGYIAATHANGSLLGPTSLYPGSSTPAKPGETITLYAVGFGLPTTTLVNGSASQYGSLPVRPVCQVGGTAAAMAFAGVVSPGLYQLNLTIPATAANGDSAVSCTYNGSTTPAGALITAAPPAPTGVTLLHDVTSSTASNPNNVCTVPPSVTSFPVTAPNMNLFWDVTGAKAGDYEETDFYRPDGTVFYTNSGGVATPGSNTYLCFWYQIPIAGAPAASYPGTWTARSYWNHSSNPLYSLSFTVVGATPNRTLTITASGTGSGTVGSSPAGTSCGSGCLSFAAGTTVTLTATPNTGSTFAGWSGACSGTGSCVVMMNSNLSVTAAFNLTATPGPVITSLSEPVSNPLALITITGTGFTADATVNFAFVSGQALNQVISITPVRVSATSILVSAPALFNSTGGSVSGIEGVSVMEEMGTSNSVNLDIVELPQPQVSPGTVTIGFLQGLAGVYGASVNASQYQAGVAASVTSINQLVSLLTPLGNGTVTSVTSGTTTYTTASLSVSDRLLIAAILEIAALPPTGGLLRSAASAEVPTIQQSASVLATDIMSPGSVGIGTTFTVAAPQVAAATQTFMAATTRMADPSWEPAAQIMIGVELVSAVGGSNSVSSYVDPGFRLAGVTYLSGTAYNVLENLPVLSNAQVVVANAEVLERFNEAVQQLLAKVVPGGEKLDAAGNLGLNIGHLAYLEYQGYCPTVAYCLEVMLLPPPPTPAPTPTPTSVLTSLTLAPLGTSGPGSATLTALGGAPVTGVLTFSAPVQAGGVNVTMTSDNSAAQVGGNVTVNGGQSSATFTINTSTVQVQTVVHITATLQGMGSVVQTAILTLTPLGSETWAGSMTGTECGHGTQGTISPCDPRVGSWSFSYQVSITCPSSVVAALNGGGVACNGTATGGETVASQPPQPATGPPTAETLQPSNVVLLSLPLSLATTGEIVISGDANIYCIQAPGAGAGPPTCRSFLWTLNPTNISSGAISGTVSSGYTSTTGSSFMLIKK